MDNSEDREQLDGFMEECADNVEYKRILRLIADSDAALNEMMDIVPIAETIKVKMRL